MFHEVLPDCEGFQTEIAFVRIFYNVLLFDVSRVIIIVKFSLLQCGHRKEYFSAGLGRQIVDITNTITITELFLSDNLVDCPPLLLRHPASRQQILHSEEGGVVRLHVFRKLGRVLRVVGHEALTHETYNCSLGLHSE